MINSSSSLLRSPSRSDKVLVTISSLWVAAIWDSRLPSDAAIASCAFKNSPVSNLDCLTASLPALVKAIIILTSKKEAIPVLLSPSPAVSYNLTREEAKASIDLWASLLAISLKSARVLLISVDTLPKVLSSSSFDIAAASVAFVNSDNIFEVSSSISW